MLLYRRGNYAGIFHQQNYYWEIELMVETVTNKVVSGNKSMRPGRKILGYEIFEPRQAFYRHVPRHGYETVKQCNFSHEYIYRD